MPLPTLETNHFLLMVFSKTRILVSAISIQKVISSPFKGLEQEIEIRTVLGYLKKAENLENLLKWIYVCCWKARK